MEGVANENYVKCNQSGPALHSTRVILGGARSQGKPEQRMRKGA